jgi:uncharacterized protein with beta-barrel porin domain
VATTSSVQFSGGSGRSDLFQAGAFIGPNIGAAYLTATLAYGWQDITTDRIVTVAGVDRLHAEFNANAWSGRVEGGYRFDTRSELGLRTDKSFAVQDAILTRRGRAAWAHDFNPDRTIGATFQTLPGASFVVNGAPTPRSPPLPRK